MVYLLLYVLFGALDYVVRVGYILKTPMEERCEFEGVSEEEVKRAFFITALVWPLNWVVTLLLLVLPMKERD